MEKSLECRITSPKLKEEHKEKGIEGEQRCLNAQVEKLEKINTNPTPKN